MKTWTALLFLPLSAHAATDVRCSSGLIHYNLIAPHDGITQAGSLLTIVANGILHTVIDSRIDAVDLSQPGKVIAAVTTLNQDGEEDAESGKATVELEVNDHHDGSAGQNANGKGHIHLLKNPPAHPSNIEFRPDYELLGCVGGI